MFTFTVSTLIVRMPSSFPPTLVISEPSGALGHAAEPRIIVAGDFLGAVRDREMPVGRVKKRAEDAAQDRVRFGVAIAGGECHQLVRALVDQVGIVECHSARQARGWRAVVSVAATRGATGVAARKTIWVVGTSSPCATHCIGT